MAIDPQFDDNREQADTHEGLDVWAASTSAPATPSTSTPDAPATAGWLSGYAL